LKISEKSCRSDLTRHIGSTAGLMHGSFLPARGLRKARAKGWC
jgi:hypothetical protein